MRLTFPRSSGLSFGSRSRWEFCGSRCVSTSLAATRATNRIFPSKKKRHQFKPRLKNKLRLDLKHSRRVDVRERWNRIRRSPHTTNKLPERRHRSLANSEDCHTATEEVSMIEEIETFQSHHDRLAF